MKNILLTLLGVVCLGLYSFAQDTIIKVNNEEIKCRITEIGMDEIHYTLPEYREDISFSIDRNLVQKILLEDGKEIIIENSMYGTSLYESQHKNALKVNFLSPLFGSTNISYEHSLQPGKSVEFTLGIIGAGNDIYELNGSGAFLKAGYKFIKSPDFYIKGMRYAHILKGTYFKPEIAISIYSYNDDYWYYDYGNNGNRNDDSNFMFAFLLGFGKQWVINNQFLVDNFYSIGYGFGKNDLDNVYHYGFTGAINDFPLTFSLGIRIGLLFN